MREITYSDIKENLTFRDEAPKADEMSKKYWRIEIENCKF